MIKKNKLFNKSNNLDYNFIWTKEKPMTFITEAYHKFLANLEYVNVDKKYKVLQITSSVSSEGKSTFISNVSYLLGQKKKKVILVDLDLRRPKVHRVADVENKNGITDVLAGRVTLEEAIITKKEYGFDFLTSGESTNTIINLLESNKIKEVISELKKKYDYVLLDSPPVLNVSDALYISKLSDALIFAISLNSTKRGVVREAKKLLDQNNINVIGIVLTQVDIKKSTYGYGYGYGYSYYDENN